MKAWKKGAMVGGIWGLISAIEWVMYAYALFGGGGSVPESFLKVRYFPGYVSMKLTSYFLSILSSLLSSLKLSRVIENLLYPILVILNYVLYFTMSIFIGGLILGTVGRFFDKLIERLISRGEGK